MSLLSGETFIYDAADNSYSDTGNEFSDIMTLFVENI